MPFIQLPQVKCTTRCLTVAANSSETRLSLGQSCHPSERGAKCRAFGGTQLMELFGLRPDSQKADRDAISSKLGSLVVCHVSARTALWCFWDGKGSSVLRQHRFQNQQITYIGTMMSGPEEFSAVWGIRFRPPARRACSGCSRPVFRRLADVPDAPALRSPLAIGRIVNGELVATFADVPSDSALEHAGQRRTLSKSGRAENTHVPLGQRSAPPIPPRF